MRLKAGFRKLAARMVGRPQQARFVKRPSVFIEGDRLLPEDIKPWKGSGTVPIRIAPTGLGVLQVPLSEATRFNCAQKIIFWSYNDFG